MGKVVEKKKKKKGRPSLLDLQKRTLKEQQQQQTNKNHDQKHTSNSAQNFAANYNSATSTPLRRSTRRNPNPSPERAVSDDEDDEDDELAGNRREKELKLVLKLQKSSSHHNSNSNASDSDENAAFNHRKRKINAIGGGSASVNYEKGEKSVSGTNPTHNNQGALLESGPSTPLPDKKLLLFILDRLQKKDTYGVFSEPVDPKDLPDYHEVIEHPMDFATLRNKLSNGAYSSLEEFEKDVFLICSNAMQYNAPDTIYFRQARSIQELARKNFQNLRQDSDDNQAEPKVVRRGRPPTKNWKKPPGRPPLERARSEFSSDATLATGPENAVWATHDLRRGHPNLDKSGFADSSGRFYGSHNDVHSGLLADNRFERNDEVSMSKGYLIKHGKRQFVPDENRRNTYKQDHQSAGGREVSVLTTFDAERKQLLAVGVHSEHGYTRSLSRFAANLGPLAWKIASKRIERCLPAGTKFGPGWVGENDVTPSRPLLVPSPPPGVPSTSSKPFFILENLCSAATTTAESKGDKLTEKPVGEDLSDKHEPSTLSASEGHLKKPSPTSALHSSSLFAANRSSEPCTQRPEVVARSNTHSGVNILNTTVGANDTRPPIHIHQSSIIHPGMNGINGTHGFNLPAQMRKLIGAARSGEFSFQPSQMLDRVSRTNTNFVHSVNASNLNSEDSKFADISSKVIHSKSLPNSECDSLAALTPGRGPPTWQGLSPQPKPDSGLSPQQKSDSVPPDLNVRFHSPGSPSSSRVDSTQPDLALQL